MRHEVLDILNRRLSQSLLVIDSRAEAAIRSAFATVGPSPTSPYVNEVMGSIQESCIASYSERTDSARRVIAETLHPYKAGIGARDVQHILNVVMRHFPSDKYIELIAHTRDVFERRQSAPQKFQQNDFDFQFTLIKTSAHSMSIRATSVVKLDLDEAVVQAKHERTPIWKKLLRSIWFGLAFPTIKWIAGIVAALTSAYLVWYFGLR